MHCKTLLDRYGGLIEDMKHHLDTSRFQEFPDTSYKKPRALAKDLQFLQNQTFKNKAIVRKAVQVSNLRKLALLKLKQSKLDQQNKMDVIDAINRSGERQAAVYERLVPILAELRASIRRNVCLVTNVRFHVVCRI